MEAGLREDCRPACWTPSDSITIQHPWTAYYQEASLINTSLWRALLITEDLISACPCQGGSQSLHNSYLRAAVCHSPALPCNRVSSCQKEARPLCLLCVWQGLEGSFLRVLCLVNQPARPLCSRSPLPPSWGKGALNSPPLTCSAQLPERLETPVAPAETRTERVGKIDCELLKTDNAVCLQNTEAGKLPFILYIHLLTLTLH